MSNDQENIKKIQEKKVHPDALNSLVHQICSEMLTIKKELTELKEEIKMVALERKEVNEQIDSRTGKILSSEEAVTHLGRALLGDNNEKGRE